MKTRISPSWVLGLVLVASVPLGFAQDSPKSPEPVAAGKTLAATPAKPYQSPWFTQLARLARAGIDERVQLAFVDSAGTFNLDPEQLISLRDLGVSNDVINAILQHDSEIALGLRQVPASTAPDSSSALEKLLVAGNKSSDTAVAKPAAGAVPKAGAPATATSLPSTAPVVTTPELAPSRSLEVTSLEDEEMAPGLTFGEPVETTASTKVLSPVRKPYPEQLTNPIIMVKAAGRMPNLVVIEWFPDSADR